MSVTRVHEPSPHKNWLNSKKVKALGKVMCESLKMRAFLLEKFPQCFISRKIPFYGENDESDELVERLKEKLKNGVKIKPVLAMIKCSYIKKMKLPQSKLFSQEKIGFNENMMESKNEISQMCFNILMTSSSIIEEGFEIKKLVDNDILVKECKIYFCKSCKNHCSFVQCTCGESKIYPIYSFEQTTWDYWSVSPSFFLEAMCAHITEECTSTNFFLAEKWDDGKERREIDFVSRDKKIAILCSITPNSSSEKKQVAFCKRNFEKIIFVSTEKENPYGEDVIFVGGAKSEPNFQEILLEKVEN
jgi:hypothetical protein